MGATIIEQERIRGPIKKRGKKNSEFAPLFTTVIKTGEITHDHRDTVWRDKLLNGNRPIYDWTSLRGEELIGPGNRRG